MQKRPKFQNNLIINEKSYVIKVLKNLFKIQI